MRIAVIGCGSIGRRHIVNLLALGERDVMVFDSHEGQKADVSGTFDVPLAPRISDIWEWQPEAVLICTPPDSHAELARTAAYEGVKGIFIEKPLGLMPILDEWMRFLTSPDDCVTMVACQWRWHPAFRAVKGWIDEGVIRQPAVVHAIMAYDLRTRPDYRTCYASTTGAAMDVAWHLVDLAIWIFGTARLKAVNLTTATQIGLECDGTAEVELEHETGTIFRLLGDFASGVTERSFSVVGAGGEPDIKMLFGPTDRMYVDEMRDFLTCVRENKPTCNPIAAASDTLALLLEAKAWAK